MCGLEILGEKFTTMDNETKLSNANLSMLSIFDNMDAFVYVASMDTYEILFTNKALNEMLGQNVTGMVCYEVLQGKHEPCLFCTNDKIKELGDVYVWEFYHERGRWYKCVDKAIPWHDGSIVRLEIAVDITDIKRELIKLDETVDGLKEAIGIITRGI